MKGFYNSIRLKKEVLGFFYKNTRFIFMSLSLVLGVLAGTLAFKSGFFSDGSLYSNLFYSFVSSRTKLSAFGIFLNSFAGNLIFLLVSFCCGLFLFGKPLSFAVPFFKGVGLGCICSSAYSVMGIEGMAFCTLIILPGAFVFSCVLLYCCLSAGQFSSELYNRCFSDGSEDFKPKFKKYCIGFIKYISITVFGSLIDCLTVSLFSGAFSL